MKTSSPTKLCVVCALLPLIACSKKEKQATPAALPVASPATPLPAAASSSPQETPHFTAEIVAHEEFQKIFAPRMMFRLEPYAANDSGWTIRIAPTSETGGPAIDCIGAVETPLHGDTKLEIEPPQTGAANSPAWKQREFEYVATAPDCKIAWDLLNNAYYATKLSDKEREDASAKLAQLPTRHGKFTVLDARIGPATPQNAHGTIESLTFEVDLSGASAATAPPQAVKPSPIRALDLKPFIESHLGELNPLLADLPTDCGEDQKHLQSLAPILYADLDGDGQEEAAVEGFSCLSGNGGADFRGVIKLMPDGKLAVLPFEDAPRVFKGRNPYADLRGHMVIQIQDGRFVESYGIYNGTEPNCCPEGGDRHLIYRWDGHRFVLDDIIDVPPSKNEKGGN